MEILAIIGVITIIVLIFTGGGLLGHLFNLLAKVYSWIEDGCASSTGCLIIIVFVFLLLLLFI